MALSAELRSAAARYYGYMGATEGNLTDKQHLEVNELAMRAILKLDSLEGLPGELRALRKHLTARALRLQDEVHSAYAKSTTRPTQLRQPTDTAAAPAASGREQTQALDPRPRSAPPPSPSSLSSLPPSLSLSLSPSPFASPPRTATPPSSSRLVPTRPPSPPSSPLPQSSPSPPSSSTSSSPALSPSSSAALSDSFKSCFATPSLVTSLVDPLPGLRAWALSNCPNSDAVVDSHEETFEDALEDAVADRCDAVREGVVSPALWTTSLRSQAAVRRKAVAQRKGLTEDVEMPDEMPDEQQRKGAWWSARGLWGRMRTSRGRRNR
ncbi:hypothetical protein Vafri_17610 [Volvox africanus]|uniref:BAG domain-containing protein n=1 Tax=Volvox africanus TaxID=51714 RepID=A0A8J4BQV3_9CHLO|nr:hypothetical protein Vafri_17610 [Volvox africanus]